MKSMKICSIILLASIALHSEANNVEDCREKSGSLHVNFKGLEFQLPSFMVNKGQDEFYGASISYVGPSSDYFFPVCDIGLVNIMIGDRGSFEVSPFAKENFVDFLREDESSKRSMDFYLKNKKFKGGEDRAAVIFIGKDFIFLSTADEGAWKYFMSYFSEMNPKRSRNTSDDLINSKLQKLRKMREE